MSSPPARLPPRRRGFALVMVLSVLAVCAALAYAMLSAATLESRSQSYQLSAARAASLAESGVNLAFRYILHPDEWPGAKTSDAFGKPYFAGQSGLSLSGEGSFDVRVQRSEGGIYKIVGTGHAIDATGEAISRDAQVTVRVEQRWRPLAAVQSKGYTRFSDKTTIKGGVVVDGNLDPGGTIDGKQQANNLASKPPGPPVVIVPAFDDLTLVRAAYGNRKYQIGGRAGVAQLLASPVLPATLTPAADNPANVWIWPGSQPLRATSTSLPELGGTLVVLNSTLSLESKLRVRPLAGMPALLARGGIAFNTAAASAHLDGVTHVGDITSTFGSKIKFESHGALLLANGAGSRVATQFRGELKAEMRPDQADVPDLVPPEMCPILWQILSWSE